MRRSTAKDIAQAVVIIAALATIVLAMLAAWLT